MFQIPNEVIKGIAVKTIGKYNELRAARAKHTASAAGEREHAAGILGKHGIDGVGPIAFVELRRTANTHGDKARPAVIAASMALINMRWVPSPVAGSIVSTRA